MDQHFLQTNITHDYIPYTNNKYLKTKFTANEGGTSTDRSEYIRRMGSSGAAAAGRQTAALRNGKALIGLDEQRREDPVRPGECSLVPSIALT